MFALVCATGNAFAADAKPAPGDVVVEILKKPLPSKEDARSRFLWDGFANKPDERKFGSYTVVAWKENYAAFSEALVKKAEERKLDSTSLRKALDQTLRHSKDRLAYLPVGAYQTALDSGLVWIVTVKWERAGSGEQAPNLRLSHIRAFAFDQKSLKRVGFMTCK